ncbi:MAG: YbaB/EbfC family nucleoid-associated protein [Bacilli bacterium]|nr:YbaB/EbfC family nucleoid-associated protein [Bacilli bacterium]
MNIQAMMKQAQKIQKEMTSEKNKIDETIYDGTSSIVNVKVKGNKEIVEVKIDADSLDKEDIEMLEDMIVVAMNDANQKIDKDTEAKLGKYTKGMPGF